jgi:hypothetical protein
VRLSHTRVRAKGLSEIVHVAQMEERRVHGRFCLLTGAFEMGDTFFLFGACIKPAVEELTLGQAE